MIETRSPIPISFLAIAASLMLAAFLLFSDSRAADIYPGFETQDLTGSTVHYNGTMGTSNVAIPTVADKVMAEVLVKCPYQTPLSVECYVSFDSGTTFFTLGVGEYLGWSLKGNIKQIYIKGSTAGVAYQIIANYEDY